MNWENMQVSMQSKYRLNTEAAVHRTKWLFCRLFYRLFPEEQPSVESYFSAVTGFAILLKQYPTTCVFVKTFQNFQNRYFYVTPLDGCI